MNEGQEHQWHIELDYLYHQVKWAMEILGRGKPDCAYLGNKALEPVLFRLKYLCEETKGEQHANDSN